jgi:hypothetical protein
MNTGMFENPVTQDNLDLLRKYGWEMKKSAFLIRKRRHFSTTCA